MPRRRNRGGLLSLIVAAPLLRFQDGEFPEPAWRACFFVQQAAAIAPNWQVVGAFAGTLAPRAEFC
jgi:preprotein translocase subunit Sec61beta